MRFKLALSLIVLTAIFNSCSDNYYELNKPSWLGESIYEQLKVGYKDGSGVTHTFNTYVRLVEDIGYKEVLRRTGSKTLFVSDDEAFKRFFLSNPWGVTSYEGLTAAQKKLIMNSSMINNAYLIELMSATTGSAGPVQGQAMRRATAVSSMDSIPFEKGDDLPQNNKYWDAWRTKGMWLAKDNTPIPMVHFLQRQMDYKGITDYDFTKLFNGATREKNDAHIFGNKVVVRDITCKNGYINILQDVQIPMGNMAEVIRSNPDTKLFSSMLDRYSAPYFSKAMTDEYKLLHPEFTDSIFVKKYFAERSGEKGTNNLYTYPGGDPAQQAKKELQKGYLEFDPGWNTLFTPSTGTSNNNVMLQQDMSVMFVPTDEAINRYFFQEGGRFLTEKYGSIENIPSQSLAELVKNLMKPSFVSAVPSKFPGVLNDGQEPMEIDANKHLIKTQVANNGAVYFINQVFAPASYVAVTAPMYINDMMKIFTWAVKTLKFDAYLLSMDSRYSFIVPGDFTSPLNEKMGNGMYYIDPVSLNRPVNEGKNKFHEIFRFWFNNKLNKVSATAYKYTPDTKEVGDSIRLLADDEVTNRLTDMLDNHIVVGNIEDGKEYYRTKGGGELRIKGTEVGMKILGTGNQEQAIEPVVSRIYNLTKESNGRGNGKTYVVQTPLLPSYRSVFNILSNESKFSEFFNLLNGVPTKYSIFFRDTKSNIGMDYNIKFFNTYHYTVYAPSNEAMQDAYQKGLPTWEIVNQETNVVKKDSLTEELVNFLRYHFQDNSVYIDGVTNAVSPYETAAYYTAGDVKSYYRLYTKLTPTGLSVAANLNDLSSASAAHVIKDNELYNIMSREYKFNTGDIATATRIETSSHAVVHQVDKVLLYRSDLLDQFKKMTGKAGIRKKINKSRR